MSPVELPTLQPAAASAVPPVAAISRQRYEDLARRVRLLSWGIAKERLADQLGSAATKGEGRQNALVGAWWLDPIVGLLIAAVAVREGAKAWRGEGCCVSSPLDGAGFVADDGCEDDCCAEKG